MAEVTETDRKNAEAEWDHLLNKTFSRAMAIEHLAQWGVAHREAERERAKLDIATAFDCGHKEGVEAERQAVVDWLKAENGLCDCFAREENECICGAWDGYKTKPRRYIADAIEHGDHRKG